MQGRLRWVQLSDLHISSETKRDVEERVVKPLAADLRRLRDETGDFDLVLFTGDIAQSGKPEQYALAAGAIDQLLEALDLPRSAVLLVPGNHDIDWDHFERAHAVPAKAYSESSLRDAVDPIWEPDRISAIEKKFTAYLDFAELYADVVRGPVGSWVSLAESKAGFRYRAIGLNSVWTGGSTQADRAGVPIIGDAQREIVDQHLTPTGQDEFPLTLVLQHNPTGYLHVVDSMLHEAWLGGYDAVVASGHVHESRSAEVRSVGGRHLELLGGALKVRQSERRGFSIVTVDREDGKRTVRVSMRGKPPKLGQFVPDGDRYARAPDGSFAFIQHDDPETFPGIVERTGQMVLELDRVELRFSDGVYDLRFLKRYRNDTDDPWTDVPAQLKVMAFPDDPERSKRHHRFRPLDLDKAHFYAVSRGRPLTWKVAHDHDQAKELMLRLGNQSEQFPIQPGEREEVEYGLTVTSDVWGPFLQRSVRMNTERLECCLDFPTGAISSLWGWRNPDIATKAPLQPAPAAREADGRVKYDWAADNPKLVDRYRLEWRFSENLRTDELSSLEEKNASIDGDQQVSGISED